MLTIYMAKPLSLLPQFEAVIQRACERKKSEEGGTLETPADKPETLGESESCMEQQIGEIESSTGNGTEDVEGIYLKELSEAATSPDLS